MKNFLKGLLIFTLGIISGIILLIVLTGVLALSFSKPKLIIRDNSWLVLDFAGEISEKPVPREYLFAQKAQKIELLDYIMSIEQAAIDPRIKGIIINADFTFYKRSHTEELNLAIRKFKMTGKEVIAWLSTGINSNYMMCLEADKIYMPDTNNATLSLTGYSQTIPYLKKALDQAGIEFSVVYSGKYKGTGENYIREEMSEEFVESYTVLLDGIYDDFIYGIANTRKIKTNDLAKLLSSGDTIFMNPDTAQRYGFIDEKNNYEDMIGDLSDDTEPGLVSILDYSGTMIKKKAKDKIAVIYADGTITNYYSGKDNLYGNIVGAKSFIDDIKKIKKDVSIKGVVLRVNSPGGSALASELIYQAIADLQKTKPVYVSFGPVAASGGYYISCQADMIYAMPSTVTGSIGVVSILMNFAKFGEKLGIKFETIKKNPYDDFLSPARVPSKEELAMLERTMNETYDEFRGHVRKNRKINLKDMDRISNGRIWTGTQSVDNMLSDRIGGLIDTLTGLAEKLELKEYGIVSYPHPPGLLDRLSSIGQIKVELGMNRIPFAEKLIYFGQIYGSCGKGPYYLLPYYDLP